MAEVVGARDLFIGVNAVDYSGYPDCRPQYIEAFQAMANLATRAGVEADDEDGPWLKIHAPLVDLTKVQIIERGLALGVDFGRTHSCYDPQPAAGRRAVAQTLIPAVPCGHCDACLLRIRAFHQLDPTRPGDAAPPRRRLAADR